MKKRKINKNKKYTKLDKENFEKLEKEYLQNTKIHLWKCYNRPSYNKQCIFNYYDENRKENSTELKIRSYNAMYINLFYMYKKNNKKHIVIINPVKKIDYIKA